MMGSDQNNFFFVIMTVILDIGHVLTEETQHLLNWIFSEGL
jgi:hypothetical protein